MTRHRHVGVRTGLLLSSLACLLSFTVGGVRPASAGDPQRPDAGAAVAVATLEAANLRAKVKLELARLLERAGRTEEAMAALLEADRLLAEAAKAARVPATPASPPPRPGPVAIGPSVAPIPPRLAPRRDPVPAAVRYLLGRQGLDGAYDRRDGENRDLDPAPADGRSAAVTAWALLALSEVATGDGPFELGAELTDRAVTAAGRAAGFLLSSAKEDGALAATAEDHNVAGWALASALSRLGPRLVEALPKELGLTADDVERRVVSALRRTLSLQDAATGRLAGSGSFDEELRASVAFLGFLHEVEPLPLARPFATGGADGLGAARMRVAAAFSGPLPPEGTPATAAGREALALRRHQRAGLSTTGDRRGASDPIRLLYGTVAACSLDPVAEGEAWWRDVLVPAMNAQALDGVHAGSFPSGPEGLGRSHATAVSLLAWLYPDMEWRTPTTGN